MSSGVPRDTAEDLLCQCQVVPVPAMDYNAYQRSLYSETPSTIAHPTPHPPVPQFISDAHSLPHGMSPGLPVTNDEGNIYALVIDLMDPETREAALLELSKKREQYDDLALVLWHAFGSSPFTTVVPAMR
jgi:CCR4-NOT transcription complex subunit 9